MTAPDFVVLLAAVALPFVAAATVPLAWRALGERTGYYGAVVSLAVFALLATQHGASGTVGVPWIPSLAVGLRFGVDAWGLLLALLASGIGVLVFAYSVAYLHGEEGLPRYYAALLAFTGSILGVALAGDLVLLFLFWELTSVASFVLIGFHSHDAESQYASRMAMLLTVGGGLFLLVAFVLLRAAALDVLAPTGADAGLLEAGAVVADASGAGGTRGGAIDLATLVANEDAIREQLRADGRYVPVLLLLALGAGAKSAQVPLHVWLPNAMVAPTPISAFLHSATMVTLGVYVLGRLRPLLAGPEWTALFAPLGIATMTVGAVLAVASTDVKELLAYSTASHLGLMVAGLGFAPTDGATHGANYGAAAAALHLLNHAAFKAALFLVAGIVAHQVGTRRLAELGGLWRDLPVVAVVTGLAALAMAGIPPFSGFYSKELLFEAAWEAGAHRGGAWWLLPTLAVVASAFTVLYSLRFCWLFVGEPREGRDEDGGVSAESGVDVHGGNATDDSEDGASHGSEDGASHGSEDGSSHGSEDGTIHGSDGGAIPRPSPLLLAPPVVLAVVVAVTSFLPEIAADAIVGDAAAAVGGSAEAVHVGLPTYVTPPVAMSGVSLFAGAAAFPVYGRLHRGLRRGIDGLPPVRPSWWYDRGIAGLEHGSHAAISRVQTGLLRTYAFWFVAGTVVLALAGYAAVLPSLPPVDPVGVSLPIVAVLAVAVVAAAGTIRAPAHVVGVLLLSLLGLMLAIFFILASAPDLALTQLVVETLTLLIFLLVIEELPAFYGELDVGLATRDAALSLAVGATAFVTVLLTAGRADSVLAPEFVDHAVDVGGGANVVNVILTDFRAFDTLGESLVIALAAISVLTLVLMRDRGESP